MDGYLTDYSYENTNIFNFNRLIKDMEKTIFDFTVLIEQDEDGVYIATVPDLDGCYTQGKTVSEALDRIKEAIEVCIESEKEEIKPLRFIGLQRVRLSKQNA